MVQEWVPVDLLRQRAAELNPVGAAMTR